MITLISGQPGHGKTLRAMQLALEFQAKGREVYVHGVRGLKAAEAGFIELGDPRKWEDLPDGSVVVLDECYGSFPRRSPGAKVPDYVDAMARHRHRGFDFILICQQAKQQIDGFLLGLVDRHEHVRRRFGLQKSVILSWDKFTENTNDSTTKKLWSFPKDVMRRELYESTTQDTTQKKIPWFIYAFPVVVVAAVFFVWRVNAWFHPDPPPGVPKAADIPMVGQGRTVQGDGQRRPEDLVKWLTPRVAGQPWTAPAYDGRPVVSEPELYCMALEDGRCNCITEQGTRYKVDLQMCRALVDSGGSYNPTRRPVQRQDQPQQQQQASGGFSVEGALGSVAAGVTTRGYPSRGIGSAYAPPELASRPSDTPLASSR